MYPACASVREGSGTKVWLIDEHDATLYRATGAEKEEYLIIQGNLQMRRFRCVDESATRGWMK